MKRIIFPSPAAIVGIAGLLFAGGCRIPKPEGQVSLPPLPDRFVFQSDTMPIRLPGWKALLTDPGVQACIDTALQVHPLARHARWEVLAQQSVMGGLQGATQPMAGWGATSSLRKFGLYTMDGAGNATTDIRPGKIVPEHLPDFLMGFQSSWETDLAGQIKNRKKAALRRWEASQEGENWFKTQWISKIACQFVEVRSLEKELEVLGRYLQLQQEALELVRLQKLAGKANELAVKQMEAQLEDIRGSQIELGFRKKEALLEIQRLSGKVGPVTQPIQWSMPDSLPLQISTVTPRFMLERRPDLKQARRLLEASGYDLEEARRMFYPNLSLQANLGQQAFRPDFLLQFPTSLAYMAAAGISGPLVNRKALKAGYSMARARKMQALAEFHHVSNEAYLEVSGLLALEQSLREAWTVKSREVAILQSSRELAISLFAAGSATYLEVVLSQQQVLNAERQRVHLQKAFLQNQICLYKAVGGGVL